MNVIKTPIDDLMVKISTYTMKNVRTSDPFLSLLLNQLSLLRTLYLELHDYDFYSHIKNKAMSIEGKSFSVPISESEFVFDSTRTMTNSAILRYQSFISVINQFGRALEEYGIDKLYFPNYCEVRFYRNKVSEHWEDYVNIVNASMVFEKAKGCIPYLIRVYKPSERLEVARQIRASFSTFDVEFIIPDEFIEITMNSRDPSKYTKFIYENLKRIRADLNFPHKKNKTDPEYELISLLFEFGFPAPIYNFEDYFHKLSFYIDGLVEEKIN